MRSVAGRESIREDEEGDEKSTAAGQGRMRTGV